MDPHQEALLAAAARLGIEANDLSAEYGLDAVAYRRGDRRALVLKGRIYPSLTAVSERLCDDKQATKTVLRALGIPCPESVVFSDPEAEEPALAAFLARHTPAVSKPLDGTDGEAVVLDLTAPAEIVDHWREHRGRYERFLLEEQVDGGDLRMQAVGGKLVAACRREPGSVTGDGRSTVAELVAARDRQVRAQNPNNRLEVDRVSRELLREQGLTLEAVPAPGRRVWLKKVANLGQGGDLVDVTGELHPRWEEWVEQLAEALGLRIFSLDAITADPARDPATAARVLELNARAQWLHHTFPEGGGHDLPGLILADLLPP